MKRCNAVLRTAVWLVFLPILVEAQEIHSEHFLYGQPLGSPATNDLIIRDLYALSSNDSTRFADWVAFRLTAAEVVGRLDLEREWHIDPWLDPEETLEADEDGEDDDYVGAHGAHDYDRGHLVPLGSVRGSQHASEVNFYSNIVPQLGPLNQGPWRRSEDSERELVCAGNVIWVMAGTLYDGVPAPTLPQADEEHEVPTGFWRVIAFHNPDTLWVAAFTFEQDTPGSDEVEAHLTSVDDVEARSGLDLFHMLPDAQETQLEARVIESGEWNAVIPNGACERALRLVPE